MSLNRAILLGNVGQDPEIRATATGEEVATLSLATNESWKDKTTGERRQATEWHKVVIFNQNIVKVVRNYVKKGSSIAIEGSIKTRKWQDKTGTDRWSTEIIVGRFDGRLSLEGDPGHGGSGNKDQRDEVDFGTRSTRSAASQPPDLDDDVPF